MLLSLLKEDQSSVFEDFSLRIIFFPGEKAETGSILSLFPGKYSFGDVLIGVILSFLGAEAKDLVGAGAGLEPPKKVDANEELLLLILWRLINLEKQTLPSLRIIIYSKSNLKKTKSAF